jgi:sterol desaturase/sphingolipid hydroxylase (fatty acid hydroxylase superfamily)
MIEDFIVSNQTIIRLSAFGAIFAIMATWEVLNPRRPLLFGRGQRWPNNVAIAALNAALVRFTFPSTAALVALSAEQQGWGLLNSIDLPHPVAIIVSIIALDLIIYLQHILFHAAPALWRLHRMHHTDLDFDVTTSARFHPIEILLSMIIKLVAIIALGVSAIGFVIFEVLLNGTAMFNHGNVTIPPTLDRLSRWVVVTPDMHRVHHSIVPQETNSNFGFNLPWWDRLLGTYRAQPAARHENMTIGINQFRDVCDLRLDRMLIQSIMEPAGDYPIGRQGED